MGASKSSNSFQSRRQPTLFSSSLAVLCTARLAFDEQRGARGSLTRDAAEATRAARRSETRREGLISLLFLRFFLGGGELKEGSDQEREGERKRARVRNSFVDVDFSLLLLTLPLPPSPENENDPRPPFFLVKAARCRGATVRGRPSRTRHEAKAVPRKNRASCTRRRGRAAATVAGRSEGRGRPSPTRSAAKARSRRRLSSQDDSHVRSGLQSLRADLGGREALLAGAASGGERPVRSEPVAVLRADEVKIPPPPPQPNERASERE